jgi:two-component system, cell cycle sensor histidine kinase and response regulator CckA
MAHKNKSAADLIKKVQELEKEVQAYKIALKRAESISSDLQLHLNREKECNEQLVHNEHKYRQIIESIQEGYFETSLEGRISFVNQALIQISGYEREELVGAEFHDFTPPRTARAIASAFGKVLKTGKDVKVRNYEVFHKDGHTLIIEFSATLIRDQNGSAIGFRGILRDVSNQVKAAENEKHMQAQLQQAQKMEALGTLAGGLAHGFNNVLMAIQGNLSIMRINFSSDGELQRHLERINHSAEKGGRLAKEILSFAKVGKFVVMSTDLNKIMKSTSRMFTRSNNRLEIHEIYEKKLWYTQVDRVQIGQVLLSLYMNAAEAMPNGGELYLQSENIYLDETYTKPFNNKPGRYVKISVTDSGNGLDREAKRRIFEPFFSPYRPIRYEGLGLAAAYGTIKSHHGMINVYSEKGHGTTFNIYLPASEKDLESLPDGTEADKGSETVLIVDDDPVASRMGRDILERWGYRAMVADNGREAIEIYSEYKERIQLVLLDVILPDLSGDQVFFSLREIKPDVLVIAASGYNVNQQIAKLLNYGCADFIQKPFQSRALSSKVRAALDREATPSNLSVLYPG